MSNISGKCGTGLAKKDAPSSKFINSVSISNDVNGTIFNQSSSITNEQTHQEIDSSLTKQQLILLSFNSVNEVTNVAPIKFSQTRNKFTLE